MPTEYDPETGKPIPAPRKVNLDKNAPSFNRDPTLADVLLELRAIRNAIESVISLAESSRGLLGGTMNFAARVRTTGDPLDGYSESR